MLKSEKVLAVLLLAVALLGACRASANVNSNANAESTAESIRSMRVVTDDLGRTVNIPIKVTRVVSLAPNLTESIFAVGADDRLVGVTTFCNYPEQAKAIAKIGDTMNPNMESIVALKPDIVFVSTASQIENFTRTLEANGIAVYIMNPTSMDGVFKNLRQLGDVFGSVATADRVANDLQNRVKAVAEKSAKSGAVTRVFVQISKEPLFTIGKESFLTSILKEVLAESVTANVETAYPKLSKETASALDPEVIILSESEDNLEPNEVFKNSRAVKTKRVFKVNADLLSRPGPRLVDALEQIAGDLHPEKFN